MAVNVAQPVGEIATSLARAVGVLTVAASDAPQEAKDAAQYVCDGTADDVQIQAALDAIASTGGTVKLTEGTFTLSVAVKLYANCQLIGSGWGTIIAVVSGFATSIIRNNDWSSGGETGITVADLYILGTGQTGSGFTGAAIEFRNVSQSRIIHVKTYNTYNAGIYWWSGSIGGAQNDGNVIRDCWLDTASAVTNTTALGMATLGKWTRGLVSGCTFLNAADYGGLTLDECNRTVVESCVARDNVRAGFICEGTAAGAVYDIKYIGCVAQGNTGGAGHGFVVIEGNPYVTFIGCSSLENDRHGFRLEGADFCVLNGNVSRNNNQGGSGGDGIILVDNGTGTSAGCTYNVITNNVCRDDQATATQGFGIRSTGSADFNLIMGNVLLGNTTAQLSLSGTSNATAGNVVA